MDSLTLRTELHPADLQPIIDLHGRVYSAECGWNATYFKSFVAGPLIEFSRRKRQREQLWLAESAGTLIGCIAIVEASREEAQLRWFVVAPEARGKGLGTLLLTSALTFAREKGYATVSLWTEKSLTRATRLYERAGFKKIEAKAGWKWGAKVVEERHELTFDLSPEVGP
jgi:ribosomal protein S18 acetylase RimI-like enzyme